MNNQNFLENLVIQEEGLQDIAGIRYVNKMAFGRDGEAILVDLLRQRCPRITSLVAKIDNDIVGKLLFTPTYILESNGNKLQGLGLGPLAVLPKYQNRGIGSQLCRTGMKIIRAEKKPFVVVLGHPSYYPRFGFKIAGGYGIRSTFKDVADDAFMIYIFDDELMKGVSGTVHYRQEFDQVS